MFKSLIGNIPEESGFIKKYRFHQGWWRAFVLNEEQGKYWDKKNKKWALVCNRIKNGDIDPHKKNFLSTEIANEVMKALKIQEGNGSGMVDRDRLYNNLLSSQPLVFNFFGFFKSNKEIALKFLKTIRPEITLVEDVIFEFAPKSSGDNSAFDFGFVVKSDAGRGLIGFECKYTDMFSYKRKGSEVNYGDKSEIHEDKNYYHYFKIFSDNRVRFPDDYFSYVRNKHYNQLFRNELLAVQLKSEF